MESWLDLRWVSCLCLWQVRRTHSWPGRWAVCFTCSCPGGLRRVATRNAPARAQAQDPPGVVLLALLLLSVLVSLVAIGLMLQYVKDWSRAERLAHLALSMCALAFSWLLMQTTFAFRYAHVYYREHGQFASKGSGLNFPGAAAPDYLDFLYYAFVVGMTSQVSDVVVTSKTMRHWTLLHSVIAFAFNMLVLALSINVMAGAIQ